MTVKGDKKIACLNWIGENVNSPENRLIMGVTAISSQPFIDLYNKDVDEKTRIASCAKTIAKIAIGTTVGVIVRKSTIGLAKRGCLIPDNLKNMKKWSTVFTPKDVDYVAEAKWVKGHSKTMGTVLGTAAGLVTNFVVDMPLTKILTNFLIGKFEAQNEKKDSKGGNQ